MKIDDCVSCKNHISFQNGYVLCDYWKMQEQRVTGSRDGGVTYIVACPREEKKRS